MFRVRSIRRKVGFVVGRGVERSDGDFEMMLASDLIKTV